MSSDLPMEIASTLQSASLKRDPSPSHDLNPSTTASEKIPVKVSHPKPSSEASYGYDTYSALDDADEIDSEDEIPEYVLRPAPRRHSFPPLPDLRFEQSYLASIKGLEEEGRWGRIAWITIRDQVFSPLAQGMVWSLALHGWRYWNRSVTLSGQGIGSRIRRWWYETNNWKLPPLSNIKNMSGNKKLAEEVGDFYTSQNTTD